jgi:hypothetical protein
MPSGEPKWIVSLSNLLRRPLLPNQALPTIVRYPSQIQVRQAQLSLIHTHNKTLFVAAMCVSDEDSLPARMRGYMP